MWAAVGIARFTFHTRSGLHARYFATIDWTGPPARTAVDPTISTMQLARSWGFTPPDAFSVRWSGYLFVDRPGMYTLATTSDDGSQLYVDGRLIVDNGGAHGSITRTGSVRLDRGPHEIVLQYFQAGGPYELEWRWGYEREPPAAVPAWLLSSSPRTFPTLVAVWWLEWIWWPLAIAGLVLLARLAFQLGYWPRRNAVVPERGPERPARAALCLMLFVILTVVQTWPLAMNPAHLSRNDNADTLLNEWTLAWVAYQLPRHPLQLFEGNMFYPEHLTVAYSEALLVQAAMAAPMIWLGASPVLAYNLVLLAGFSLTGCVMCLVVARWTGDWVAGIAAGVMMAFNAHTLTRMPHLQAQHVEFLPLALLSLDALFRRPRWTSALWLALWFTLQALASIYLLVFAVVAIAAALAVRPEDWLGRPFRALAPKLALSAVLAGTALAVFLTPYRRLHAQGYLRSLDEVAWFAASARDYLTTPSRFHSWAGGDTGLFPGAVALALAAVAIASRTAFRDARARMCLAFGVCGVVLSFGPAVTPGYELLYRAVPIVQGVRTTSRFGYLGLIAVAVVGGYGVAVLRRWLGPHRMCKHALSFTVLVFVFLEPLAAPILYEPFGRIPQIYRLPASQSNAVVVEMPLPPPEAQFRNAPFLLNSTLNWRPLVNGYSGFIPASYVEHYLAMNRFPSRESTRALQAAGVTHVFVHFDQIATEAAEAIDRDPAFHRIALEGPIALYRLDPRPVLNGPIEN